MREQNVLLYCEEKHKQAAPPSTRRKQIIPEISIFEESAVLTSLLHLELLNHYITSPFHSGTLPSCSFEEKNEIRFEC